MPITKRELIESYIEKCNNAIAENKQSNLTELIDEIVSVFDSEIKNIKSGLDGYGYFFEKKATDRLGDVKKIKAKLINYLTNLDNQSSQNSTLININNQNNNVNSLENSISIENLFDNTRNRIIALESLTDDETTDALNKLEELLDVIKSNTTRKAKWSKMKNTLKWIADKSVDLALAFAPTIFQALNIISP